MKKLAATLSIPLFLAACAQFQNPDSGEPVADRDTLRQVAVDLVRSIYPPRAGIRLLGVTVSNLEPASAEPAAQMALAL